MEITAQSSLSFCLLPNGMSQADGTSMDVDFFRIDIQHFNVGQNDNAEGFVDLPKRDIISANLSELNNE